MAEHPILFSGEMVRAILEERKTQTRRVIKPQPQDIDDCPWVRSGWAEWTTDTVRHCTCKEIKNPYGNPRDLLWVRETWQAQNLERQWWHDVKRADRELHNWAWTNPIEPAYDDAPPRWLPGIHMPRAASRITLEIVNVRVEQIQSITWQDIVAEGCPPEHHMDNCNGMSHAMFGWYESLWDRINYERGYGWIGNPWVWVVEFRPSTALRMEGYHALTIQ